MVAAGAAEAAPIITTQRAGNLSDGREGVAVAVCTSNAEADGLAGGSGAESEDAAAIYPSNKGDVAEADDIVIVTVHEGHAVGTPPSGDKPTSTPSDSSPGRGGRLRGAEAALRV